MTPTKEDMNLIASLMATDFRDVIFSVIRRWEAIRPQEPQAEPPAPMTFGDPPQGYTWHNPKNLTPEQVEVDKGWRLFMKGEARSDGYEDYIVGDWTAGDREMIQSGQPLSQIVTYRTKAPLPAPKPTPEELERLEFEAWATVECYSIERNGYEYLWGSTGNAWAAWKAARNNNFRAVQ